MLPIILSTVGIIYFLKEAAINEAVKKPVLTNNTIPCASFLYPYFIRPHPPNILVKMLNVKIDSKVKTHVIILAAFILPPPIAKSL